MHFVVNRKLMRNDVSSFSAQMFLKTFFKVLFESQQGQVGGVSLFINKPSVLLTAYPTLDYFV